MKPIVAFTIGDFNGIGPEIALLAASNPKVQKACKPVLVGPLDVFEEMVRSMRKRIPLTKAAFPALAGKGIPVVDTGDGLWAEVSFGKPTKASGKTAGQALEKAIELCLTGKVNAITTGPVSKHALHLAGYTFPGQTEFVTLLSRSQRVLMVMASKQLTLGLATIHSPLKDVPAQLTTDKLKEKLTLLAQCLTGDFGTKNPRIGVLGLNPHAGERGDIGDEEIRIINPAIESARKDGMRVEGPFSADAYFGSGMYKTFDGTLAMYHDQGLVASKILSFGSGVNLSAGLSVVRTSPDHGTAYDIAGKRKANPSSFIEAALLAASIASRRARK